MMVSVGQFELNCCFHTWTPLSLSVSAHQFLSEFQRISICLSTQLFDGNSFTAFPRSHL